MCSDSGKFCQPPRAWGLWSALTLLWLVCAIVPTRAQCTFNSGSTGADGAFNPTTNQTVQLPESGVLNYTTINIPSGVTIKFARNSKNTPVTILASGNVTIAGKIDISGGNGSVSVFGAGATSGVGVGGPGGFDGGRGGYSFAPFFSATAGDGPGGGPAPCGNGAFAAGNLRYGTRTLMPLIGGSGGGGQSGSNGVNGQGGGGGGGAILIASSGTMTFQYQFPSSAASIMAKGGGGCGTGAGGGIRLVANKITGTTGFLDVGGSFHGYIRVEACDYNGFLPATDPSTTSTGDPIISLAAPSSVTLPNAPTLKITSVAGIAAPVMPNGSFHGTPDIVVPNAQTNPVTVALQAANVPLGTQVQVTVTPESGSFTIVQSTALAGSVASSTATASVNLSTTGMTLVNAQLSYDVAGNSKTSQLIIDGERIKRVEVATSFGGQSEVIYITESGKRIKRASE